jgi:hypothetical protein
VVLGDNLVATFETGCYDERGEPRSEPALAELLGIEAITGVWRPAVAEEYIRALEMHPGLGPFTPGQLIPRPSAALQVRPSPGTESPAVFLQETGRVYAALNPDSEYPALVLSSPGGSVAFLPMLLGSTAAKLKIESHRRMAGAVVRWAHGEPLPLESDAPPTVQIELRRQPGRRLIHLVNNTGDMQRPITRLIPLRDIRVALTGSAPGRLYRLSTGEELPFEQGADCIVFTLPELGLYEVVVAEEDLEGKGTPPGAKDQRLVPGPQATTSARAKVSTTSFKAP